MIAPRRFLPPIPALQALEALERLGSATAVAAELSLTQSAVSRQLQGLEEQLGMGILDRSRKRLGLSPAGAAYAVEIRAALQKIAQASLKLSANPEGGAVSLAVLPSFGMQWLVPRLPGFAARHRDVTINMTSRVDNINFDAEPFDAAIQYGKGRWDKCNAMRLVGERVLPVISRQLASAAQLKSARDLLRLPLMHIQTRAGAWDHWFATQGVETGPVGGTYYDQFSTIKQAALHGLGVGLMPEFLIRAELSEGRLVPAWGKAIESEGAYWLVWPKSRPMGTALEAFRDWLSEESGAEDMLPR